MTWFSCTGLPALCFSAQPFLAGAFLGHQITAMAWSCYVHHIQGRKETMRKAKVFLEVDQRSLPYLLRGELGHTSGRKKIGVVFWYKGRFRPPTGFYIFWSAIHDGNALLGNTSVSRYMYVTEINFANDNYTYCCFLVSALLDYNLLRWRIPNLFCDKDPLAIWRCGLLKVIYKKIIFWLHLWHVEVPGVGIEPVPQQWPRPRTWQCWIFNARPCKRTPKVIFLNLESQRIRPKAKYIRMLKSSSQTVSDCCGVVNCLLALSTLWSSSC